MQKSHFFSKNFDNFSKSMGVEKWIFSLGIFLVYFCLERVQMKEFLNYLTGKWVKSRILENFGKFFGNIFHGHFGQLNIELGGWNFCCVLFRYRPFDSIYFWVVAVEKCFWGRFSKNIFQAHYHVFGGPWTQNFGISHIVNTLIYTCNIFTTHLSHFYF